MSYSFPDRDTLNALYGNSPDAIMVEQFAEPIVTTPDGHSDDAMCIATVAYTNVAFQNLLLSRGLPLKTRREHGQLKSWLEDRTNDTFKVLWRNRTRQDLYNVQFGTYASTDSIAQQNAALMMSTTLIVHKNMTYGCWTRITNSTPALGEDAIERRALKQIDAFVRTENAPLLGLAFVKPLPKLVPASELLQAYYSSTITHISDSGATLLASVPGDLLQKKMASIDNPLIERLFTNAFPATNKNELLALDDTVELLVEDNAQEHLLYRVKPIFVFEDDMAVEAWVRIEDITLAELQARERQAMEQTRSMALAAASLHPFEFDHKGELVKIDGASSDAVASNNLPINRAGWIKFLHPDNINLSTTEIDDLVNGRTKELNFIARLTDDHGEDRFIEVWGVVNDATGPNDPGRTVGLYRDVTQSEQLNARLREKKTLEGLGVLAGGIAHDFNNLLMSVLGYAELMEADLLEVPVRDGAQLQQSGLRNIGEIRSAALRASELCASLLAYAGQHLIEKQTIDLTELVRSTIELVEVTIGQRVPLLHNLDTEAPIAADKSQLTQVIVNLVGNAADAMEGYEGAVHLSVTIEELTEAEQALLTEQAADPDARFACLSVRDEGCGMTSDTQQRLYEPFFTTKTDGRGLGMAAVHGIVKHHGGAIFVRSAPDEGTEFRVCLPLLAHLPSAEPAVAGPTSTASVEQPKVLVVDDEPGVRTIAAEMLRYLNCDVHEAESAESALALFGSHSFDCALLDITMPVMSGIELAELLLDRAPNLQVVLCSGYTDKDVPTALLARCAFIHKPYTLKEVSDVLQLDNVKTS